MKQINSLSDLLMEELADLLNAESQLVEALPKMAHASQSSALKLALEDHLEVSKEHVDRLQDIFDNIGQNPSGRICKAVQGFIADIENLVNDPENYAARDSDIIKTAQRVEHYEISRYQITREHASDLGHTRIVELLDKNLNEERATHFYLNELFQGMINIQAIAPNGSGEGEDFYIQHSPKKEK